jgi:hypothetical protein
VIRSLAQCSGKGSDRASVALLLTGAEGTTNGSRQLHGWGWHCTGAGGLGRIKRAEETAEWIQARVAQRILLGVDTCPCVPTKVNGPRRGPPRCHTYDKAGDPM